MQLMIKAGLIRKNYFRVVMNDGKLGDGGENETETDSHEEVQGSAIRHFGEVVPALQPQKGHG